jgi:putative MATE family efflux protein
MKSNISISDLSKKIFVIALPVILQNMTEYILMFTDTIFIGHYRTEGLSVIQNVYGPFFTFFSFFIAIAQGSTILIAQAIGAKQPRKAEQTAEVSFFFNSIISVLYLLFFFFLSRPVLSLIGAKGEVLTLGVQYAQIMSFIFLGMGFSLTASAIFQGIGKTMPIFISALIRTVMNVFLAWCFIFGNLGFPRLGIPGAALASLISDLTGQAYLIVFVFRIKEFKISLKGILHPVLGLYRKVLKIGIPSGAEYMLWAGGQLVLIYLLNQVDIFAAGFFGLLNTVVALSVNLYNGISIAALTLVGQAVGARNRKLAYRSGNLSVIYCLVICIVIGTIFLVYPSGMIGIFSNDPKVITELAPMMILLFGILFPKAVNISAGYAIKGTGDTRWMMWTQFAGTVLIIIMANVFISVFHLGLFGMMLAVLIDELWRGIVNYLRFLWKLKYSKTSALWSAGKV